MKANALNYLLYQSGWLVCVLGAARGHPWLGGAGALLLVAVHLGLAERRKEETAMVAAVGLLGTVADTLQVIGGTSAFAGGYLFPWLCPPWITVMWIQFATLLHFCLHLLSGRYALSAVLGAFGGPLAYYTGELLGGVTFPSGRPAGYAVLVIVWAVALPLAVWIADRPVFGRGRGTYRIFERR